MQYSKVVRTVLLGNAKLQCVIVTHSSNTSNRKNTVIEFVIPVDKMQSARVDNSKGEGILGEGATDINFTEVKTEHKLLKSVIKHFIFSVYFNKYAFLHLIWLITFYRVHISQKARCYVHQLIESFPVIYNMSRNMKKNLDSDIVDTYLHASRVFSTFLPYRPIFLYYQGDLILELVQYK